MRYLWLSIDRVTHWATGRRQGGDREATGRRQASDRQATGKRQESDRLPRWATGRREGGDREATGRRQEDDRQATGKRQASDRRAIGYHVGRQGGDGEATGRRQGGGRKTTGKRQEADREATGNSDRRATGGNDRRATGERQEGARQKVAWRQETTGSDRKRQASDRRAAGKRQGSDRGATGERQDSDREATGKRQGSDRGLKVPKQRQGGDREATGWRQEGEVARIYYSQTVSAIATATCDLRAVALLRCAVALLLFEAITLLTRSRGGLATGRCGGHTQVSRQAKHYAHKGINALSCDKAFQNPCHSAKRERKYVQQHIRICTHGVKTGLG